MERLAVTAATAFNATTLSERTTTPFEKNNNDPSAHPSLSSGKHYPPNASFSSYLVRSDDPNDKPIIESISTATIEAVSSRKITGLRQRINEMEISIFDADRYFNANHEQGTVAGTIKKGDSPVGVNLEKIVETGGVFLNPKSPTNNGDVSGFMHGSTIHRVSSVSSSDGFSKNCRAGSFLATPTASSEASWNSQSGLLSNPPGSIAVSMRNIPMNEQKKTSSSSSSKWLFGCRCPCSGKKSVEVKERITELKNPITPVTTPCNSNSSRVSSPLNLKKTEKPSLTVKLDALPMAEQPKVAGKGRGTESWETELVKDRNSERYTPEIRFQAEIGRRITPSVGPFNREEGGFSFPILNPQTGALPSKPASPPEERPRFSLEVFRPVDEPGQTKSTDLQLQRRLISFPGENNLRRSFAFPGSPKNQPGDDDAESDSSSDLFEIESFSTQTTSYPLYRRRDSLDETSSLGGSEAVSTVQRFTGNSAGALQFRRGIEEPMTPREFYEPSEASVDWSVTTAEGFDHGSVTNFSTTASEYEDVRFIMPESSKSPTEVTSNINGNGGLKRRGNALLSCRCENAVNIAPHPIKAGRKMPIIKLEEVEVTHVPRVSGRPPISRSRSAHFSRPLVSR